MAEIDPEVLERVRRWCAEAGRHAGDAEIRGALAPLTWDELLVMKALLADPPPARPLGPHALADLARGAPADVAAEREREGRYAREEDAAAREAAVAAEPAAAPSRAKRGRGRKPAAIIVRRARDRAPETAPAAPALPVVDELKLPEGRSVLERLIRTHGGRRAAIAADVAAGWRRADDVAVSEEDVAALLDLHGLAHAFEHRERDELLHALRASGGVRARAAIALGVDTPALDAALSRLGASGEAERIRDERRADLRGRATLSERVHLLLEDEERLADLGLLAEIEADLRARLPEHVKALRGSREPLGTALGRSLSIAPPDVERLATRFGVELGRDAFAGDDRPRGRTGSGDRPRREMRPGGSRPGGDRRHGRGEERRPRGDALGGERRPPERSPRPDRRPGSQDRFRGDRPRSGRFAGANGGARPRTSGAPPTGTAGRDALPRDTGPRGAAPRSGGPRVPGLRSLGPRGAGPRGPGPRGPGPRGPGPRGPGPRSAGPRGPGPRDAGPRGTGPRGPGPRGASPRGPGPRGAGPRGTGPRGPGPRGAGPRSPGPRGAAPRGAGFRGTAPRANSPAGTGPRPRGGPPAHGGPKRPPSGR